MGFSTMIPATSQELYDHLLKLHENRSHVKSIKIDQLDASLKIDLDWAANNLGNVPDMRIPLKKKDVAQAVELVERLETRSSQGTPPSRGDADALFDMIDAQRY